MRLMPAFLLLAVTASPAFAQREPEIVIPGKPGVPVYINGVDASWGVVEGEFGLDRPGFPKTLIAGPLVVALPLAGPAYHPKTGVKPGYGRLEIVPPANRPLPQPAPTYYRSWSSGSAPTPASDYPPAAPPTIIYSPQSGSSNKNSSQTSSQNPGQNSSQSPSQKKGP